MNKNTHNVHAHFSPLPMRYETCQHQFYRDGERSYCAAPTEDGKPTCRACKALESAGPRQQRKDLITTYV